MEMFNCLPRASYGIRSVSIVVSIFLHIGVIAVIIIAQMIIPPDLHVTRAVDDRARPSPPRDVIRSCRCPRRTLKHRVDSTSVTVVTPFPTLQPEELPVGRFLDCSTPEG